MIGVHAQSLRLIGTHWDVSTLSQARLVEDRFDLDRRETGFVVLHAWNVGDDGGPAVPESLAIGMGVPATCAEADRITRVYVGPAKEAARAAGLAIFHVELPSIAIKYDSVRYMLEESELRPALRPYRPSSQATPADEVNPGWILKRAERSHGKGFQDWAGWQQMHVHSSCAPQPGDQVILTSEQLDRICRSRGIKNLIYTGFATNACIVDAAGGARAMLRYGYKLFLIREATLAIEFTDTLDERLMTRGALRYFEHVLGDTIGYQQFVDACRAVAPQTM